MRRLPEADARPGAHLPCPKNGYLARRAPARPFSVAQTPKPGPNARNRPLHAPSAPFSDRLTAPPGALTPPKSNLLCRSTFSFRSTFLSARPGTPQEAFFAGITQAGWGISLFSFSVDRFSEVVFMEQGIMVLTVGMATVFAFLILLVAIMKASACFFSRFSHRFPDDSLSNPTESPDSDLERIAVAIAAVRSRHS